MKRVILIIGVLIIALGCFLLLNENNAKSEKVHQYSIENYLQFSHLYMGNASNLSQLFNQLPLSEKGLTLELYPESFSAQLNYNVLEENHIPTLEKHLKFNATVAFALIENLEHITFNFDTQFYEISRGSVQEWYDVPLSHLLEILVWDEKVFKLFEDDELIKNCNGLEKTVK